MKIKIKNSANPIILTEDLDTLPKLSEFIPYNSSPFEQPLCCTCCPPCYFKFRWSFLKYLQNFYLFSDYSIGFCLVFITLLLGSVYFVYETWGNTHASAKLPNYFLQITFLFPSKNSIWLFLTGISSENFLYWHKYIGFLSIITGIFHGFVGNTNESGLILIILMLLILCLSISFVRKRWHELFLRSHWIIFLLVIIAAYWHGATLLAVIPWLIDIFLRVYLVLKNKKRIMNLQIIQTPSKWIKLTLSNNYLQYKLGQYFLICVPEISIFEWHPFNLCSCASEPEISIYIKILGDWTKKLSEISKIKKDLNIWLDGPYGNCSLNLDGDEEYQVFLLISGGVGIASMNSLFKNLLEEYLQGRVLNKVIMVWSVREEDLLVEFIRKNREFFIKRLNLKDIFEVFYHFSGKEIVRNNEENKWVEIKSGKPNFEDYFIKARNYCDEFKKKRVAVLCCGSDKIMEDVRNLAIKWTKGSGVRFDVHLEKFEF